MRPEAQPTVARTRCGEARGFSLATSTHLVKVNYDQPIGYWLVSDHNEQANIICQLS